MLKYYHECLIMSTTRFSCLFCVAWVKFGPAFKSFTATFILAAVHTLHNNREGGRLGAQNRCIDSTNRSRLAEFNENFLQL